ncbi:alpha/beta hydrolase [Streptomyces kunmingensis]|uniref:Alpha/beta hydrolase n=1 Tax=Streptomyces kunmingensis TaxID=68225 RepID=A0ABU6C869_9ACTN|nr:alpha/beta hydrolase [Streptomyces kunmingensis]MEB3960907.1 alpha/beta hydrolase [Streptomyces kunmingensis]
MRYDVVTELLHLGEGRVLEFTERGPRSGPVVLFHHGMPGSALPMDSVLDSATERGYRVITYSRPGYGGSTRAPGRTVAGAAEECGHLMDHLGVERYLVAGWSAGGPHALSIAATDPRRVSGVLLIASFAPRDAEGLAFVSGMGVQNHVLFGSASGDEEQQRAIVSQMAALVRDSEPAELAAGMASLLPAADAAELAGAYGPDNAAHMNHALADGADGWLDDLRALTSPWGFDPGDIAAPVELWHGALDRMVPVAHGLWLTRRLPTARTRVENGHGHISIGVGSLGDKLDRLRARTP